MNRGTVIGRFAEWLESPLGLADIFFNCLSKERAREDKHQTLFSHSRNPLGKGWRAAGFETTTQMAEPHPSSLKIKPRQELFISADDLNARIAKGEVVPLDTRSDDEYYGRHKRSARAGAIPGAVHLEWLTYLDDAGRFKPPSVLGAMFKSAGITPDKAVVPY